MATFHYEVSRHRKADGTYLVSVRMTHGRRLVRRPTSIFVTRDQLSRDGKRVKVTDIYIARYWRRVWEANRKVLDLVFHS